MDRNRKTILTVDKTEFDLGLDVPVAQQEWRKYLFLVSTYPYRLLGLTTKHIDNSLRDGVIVLDHALVYLSNTTYHPVPEDPRRTRIGMAPQLAIPFEGLAPMRKVRIVEYTNVLCIWEQAPEVQEHFYKTYQYVFDSPRVEAPTEKDLLAQ